MTEDLADQKVVFLREKSIVCDLESSLCFDEIQLEEVGNNEELSMVGWAPGDGEPVHVSHHSQEGSRGTHAYF